ncbi:AAA family ATPase [Arcanobacterium hippocoleae]
MSDIVATIQAEQDRIIRDQAKGVLVVQGGPGTGKTAVALHRAAYLLYTYRKNFAHSGVLIIGPSKRFLQYIDQVLPSLGESEVVACTIHELFPGVTPTVKDNAEAAEIKSRLIWEKIAKRAVRQILEKPLHNPITFHISGKRFNSLQQTYRQHKPVPAALEKHITKPVKNTHASL